MAPQLIPTVCFDDFLLDCRSRKLSPKTLQFYREQLTPFIAFCDVEHIGEVTAAHIRRYLVHLQGLGWADASIHAAARAIKRFMRFCAAEGYIEQAPKFAMPKMAKRIMPALTVEQAQLLVDACKTGRDRALILLALDTGLRANELANLNVGDMDIQQGTVLVRSGKGAKDRMVYMGARTRRTVNRYLIARRNPKNDAPLWVNQKTGKRLTRWGVRELCDRLSKRTGLDVTPHDLRRTAVMLALRAGLPLPMIQAMLGHTSLLTTERYLSLTDEDRRQAHERFGGVDNLLK